uniref:Uncharacterized protein n=1 Tax=Oryza sativa subsp. japonica TaxID=39947 RepID=Q6K8E8_ORYSJ|nr:hypothetical protein [Oryza sativa Japonica Group]
MATVAADTGRQRQRPRKTHVKVVTASIEDVGEGQQHNLVDTSYGGGMRATLDAAEDEYVGCGGGGRRRQDSCGR